jgi:LemA protein
LFLTLRAHILFIIIVLLSGCGYNALQAQDEQIKATWSNVLAQYQRRADLIPNLVNVVKSYASHEQNVFREIAQARAHVASVNPNPENYNNPEIIRQYQEAQQKLETTLSKLTVIVENYPKLKADEHFLDLQVQLEGTENRIAHARTVYIQSILQYNITVRTFPTNLTAMLFGFKEKQSLFTVTDAKAYIAPEVNMK